MNDTATQVCGKCREVLPLDAFNRERARKCGRGSRCRRCVAAQWKKNYTDNRVRVPHIPMSQKAPCPQCGGLMQRQSRVCRKCVVYKNRVGKDNPRWKGGYYGQYGIDPDKYQFLFQMQGGVCAICRQSETNRRPDGRGVRAMPVDHDHKTNAVRGLLCGNCNRGIGLFRDNPALLALAAEYLKKHEETAVALSGAAKTPFGPHGL